MADLHDEGQQKDKGISPLISAVLLIAVTMLIAGVLALWAANFVQRTLPENETESECRFADFTIYSCRYTNSTNTINLILKNERNVNLRSLKLFLFFTNGSISEPIELSGTLQADVQLKSFMINNINDDFSKISVGTHCPGLIKEKSCTKV